MTANHRLTYVALVAALRAEFNELQLEALKVRLVGWRYNVDAAGALWQAIHDAHDINYDTGEV